MRRRRGPRGATTAPRRHLTTRKNPAPPSPTLPPPRQPNVIHFWERYESNTALGRHNTLPEVTGFMEKVCGGGTLCVSIP